jgi:hypothetical protein
MQLSNTVKATLGSLPQEFIDWLETLRNKNPLAGSKDGMNQNAVFVAIGRNLVVDTILNARDEVLHPRAQQQIDIHGSDVIMGITKE